MQVLRPITVNDFAALKEIAIESGHGFTSLPVDDGHSYKKKLNVRKTALLKT